MLDLFHSLKHHSNVETINCSETSQIGSQSHGNAISEVIEVILVNILNSDIVENYRSFKDAAFLTGSSFENSKRFLGNSKRPS